MTVEKLKELGFIHNHLFGDWYVVHLCTKGWRKFIMFPMRLKDIEGGIKNDDI